MGWGGVGVDGRGNEDNPTWNPEPQSASPQTPAVTAAGFGLFLPTCA